MDAKYMVSHISSTLKFMTSFADVTFTIQLYYAWYIDSLNRHIQSINIKKLWKNEKVGPESIIMNLGPQMAKIVDNRNWVNFLFFYTGDTP